MLYNTKYLQIMLNNYEQYQTLSKKVPDCETNVQVRRNYYKEAKQPNSQ